MSRWRDRKVLVLGYGASGKAAVNYLKKRGSVVLVADKDVSATKENIPLLHEDEVTFEGIDCLVVSPGIPQSHQLYQKAMKQGIPILGEIELGLEDFRGSILGITGTNGKTTVTSLIEHVFSTNGIPCRAVGNIGRPLSEEIDKLTGNPCLVVELSSYQLETLKSTAIDAAVVLNITPDHLDRYPSINDYAAAKLGIARCLKPEGKLFLHQSIVDDFSEQIPNDFSIYHQEYPFGTSLDHLPSFEKENFLAAFSLCKQKGITPEQFLSALPTFKKLEHRIEFAGEKEGVKYFNDSKGTNLDAAIKAVDAMKGKTILIVGGKDKGGDYTPWIDAFKDKVRFLCAIGEASDRIIETLGDHYPHKQFGTLVEALDFASREAQAGENVLLSPGCSSFDQFKNYQERGDVFKNYVKTAILSCVR